MDWILYSISLPGASYFLVVPPEDCRGNFVGPDGAQEKSMKHEGRGQGTTSEKITYPKSITNRLKSNGSKMTSHIQLNLDPNPQAKRHTQRCHDSSKALSKD